MSRVWLLGSMKRGINYANVNPNDFGKWGQSRIPKTWPPPNNEI